ncbi:hypothetical protein L596_015884 [Steinernema carpocapsae]|uniref:Uncharacterized protein n=1 Tax=Steinernema carpocapsae TaxID=34508 RepID=A0A4U5NHI9_STECR|nr:hypothetical protein L596_015884 [Steinernema carpocapsae]
MDEAWRVDPGTRRCGSGTRTSTCRISHRKDTTTGSFASPGRPITRNWLRRARTERSASGIRQPASRWGKR